MQVLVVHEKIPNGHSECPEALKSEQIFGRIIFMEVGVHRFDDKGVLREQEGRFSVDAEEEKRVDCVDDLFPDVGVEGHDEVFDFRHHRIQLGPLDIVDRLTLVALLVVLSQFSLERGVHHIHLRAHLEATAHGIHRGITLTSLYYRFPLPAGHQFGQV